jgi:hypothetical protein
MKSERHGMKGFGGIIMTHSNADPLRGISEREREIISRLLRMPPERQKAAPKPLTSKGEAQRLRRERERQRPIEASDGG